MKTTLNCRASGEPFELHPFEEEFCARLGVPLPTLSPRERMRGLMAVRNERKLYRRKCDKTGEAIISAYRPDCGLVVYKNSEWWGDGWEGTQFGREFEFSKPFFPQFRALMEVVPREGTSVFNSENCDYNGHIRESKNSYLNALAARCEDALYSYWIADSRDLIDCGFTKKSTLCYWSMDIENGYECAGVYESTNCRNCYFSFQLRGCSNCLFCSNLVNKTNYLYNKPVSPAQFASARKEVINGSRTYFRQGWEKFKKLRELAPHRAMRSLNSETVSGDYLYYCRNCFECYDAVEAEDCYNATFLGSVKNIVTGYSIGWPGSEVIYNSSVIRGSKELAFCSYCWFCSNSMYLESCVSCSDCFGCVGLKHKQYHIFNIEYSKDEYRRLVGKIMDHMRTSGELGEFFPIENSPFCYNESAAQEYFPVEEAVAKQKGWRWLRKDNADFRPPSIPAIPDNISAVDESVCQAVLACETCQKNFKFVVQEVRALKKQGLPLQTHCPDCRHQERMALRNSYKLFRRVCDNCQQAMPTTYSPEREETVYCEECFLQTLE